MTAKEQQALAMQIVAQQLAERVVEKIVARQKRAIVIFTGAYLGFDQALASVEKLRAEGFTFHVLLTRSAMNILPEEEIRAVLKPEKIWVETPDILPEMVAYNFDTFLVPTLTANTTAFLASCMSDTPARAILSNAMMRGKNVIMAIDGCCPDNAMRKEMGYHTPEPMKQKMRDNMQALRDYGAKLTTADQMHRKTLQTVGILPKTNPKAPVAIKAQSTVTFAGGKVVSQQHVRACAPNTILRVAKGTLVTQMAREEAYRRQIRIETEQ